MTTTTTVYSAPADGYVFAKPADYEENGWSWPVPTFRLAAPAAPTRYGNVLTIPPREGVRYTVNGVTVTGKVHADQEQHRPGAGDQRLLLQAGTTAGVELRTDGGDDQGQRLLKVTRKPTPRRVGSGRSRSPRGWDEGQRVMVPGHGQRATVKKVSDGPETVRRRHGAQAGTGDMEFQVKFAGEPVVQGRTPWCTR